MKLLTVFFLIPLVEHLAEITKHLVADHVIRGRSYSYLSHQLTPLYAAVWGTILLAILFLLGLDVFVVEYVVVLAGGSAIYYEISSLWKEKKRRAVPLSTEGLNVKDAVEIEL